LPLSPHAAYRRNELQAMQILGVALISAPTGEEQERPTLAKPARVGHPDIAKVANQMALPAR
jgi:hypothetical protein